jgi:hypothetical protein
VIRRASLRNGCAQRDRMLATREPKPSARNKLLFGYSVCDPRLERGNRRFQIVTARG